jgi:ABC-2 type transport system ATP-binding protein
MAVAVLPASAGIGNVLTGPELETTQQDRPPAIEMLHLSKYFGHAPAVRDLSLTIEQGEIFGLLGPNGSGKTTTINLISGLSVPTSGQVRVMGYDVRRHASQVYRLLGTVPQETALYEELSALHNMQYHAALYSVPRKERAERIRAMLSLVQLLDQQHARVATFSGGMKRRLALARALLHEPRVVYLDEPTLGVDPHNRRALYTFIRTLPAQGVTVLLTTNDMHEAEVLCHRVAILDHGQLQIIGTPQQLRRDAAGACQIELELDTDTGLEELVEALRALAGMERVTIAGDGRLHLMCGGPELLPAILARVSEHRRSVRNITIQEGHLEDAFFRLTGSLLRD